MPRDFPIIASKGEVRFDTETATFWMYDEGWQNLGLTKEEATTLQSKYKENLAQLETKLKKDYLDEKMKG